MQQGEASASSCCRCQSARSRVALPVIAPGETKHQRPCAGICQRRVTRTSCDEWDTGLGVNGSSSDRSTGAGMADDDRWTVSGDPLRCNLGTFGAASVVFKPKFESFRSDTCTRAHRFANGRMPATKRANDNDLVVASGGKTSSRSRTSEGNH